MLERYLEDIATASRVEALIRERKECTLQRLANAKEHETLKKSLAQARQSRHDMRAQHRAELLRLQASLRGAGVIIEMPLTPRSSPDVSENSSDEGIGNTESKRASPRLGASRCENGTTKAPQTRRKCKSAKIPPLFSSMHATRKSVSDQSNRNVSRSKLPAQRQPQRSDSPYSQLSARGLEPCAAASSGLNCMHRDDFGDNAAAHSPQLNRPDIKLSPRPSQGGSFPRRAPIKLRSSCTK